MKQRRIGVPVFLGLGLLMLGACGSERSLADPEQSVETSQQALWANSWENLGWTLTGKPGASPWFYGVPYLTVVWRTSSPANHVYQATRSQAGAWNGPYDLASDVGSSPSTTSDGAQREDVVWRANSNGHLKHRAYTTGWQAVDPDQSGDSIIPSGNSPAAVTWGNSYMRVFWRGSNNHLLHRKLTFSTKKWDSQQDAGSSIALASDPAVMYRGNNPQGTGALIDVFWRGSNGHLMHATMPDSGKLSAAEDLGGSLYSGSSPTAAPRWPGISLDVFYRGTDSHLKHRFLEIGTSWTAEETADASTTLASDPQAMSWGQGRVDVFAKIGTTLQHRTWSNTSIPLYGQLTDLWCWAATAQMIGSHYGIGGQTGMQCTQVTNYEHYLYANGQWPTTPPYGPGPPPDDCCAGAPNYAAACVIGGYPWYPLSYWGLAYTWSNNGEGWRSMTQAQMQNEVANGRPWSHEIDWCLQPPDPECNTYGWGVHLVAGIEAFSFNNTYWVVINDPQPVGVGTSYVQTYADYWEITNYQYGAYDLYDIY